MKNIIILALVIAAGWFLFTKLKQSGPDTTVKNYGQNLADSKEKAEEAKGLANKVTVQGAVNSFRMSNGRYPDSLQELADKRFIDRVPEGLSYNKETGEVTE